MQIKKFGTSVRFSRVDVQHRNIRTIDFSAQGGRCYMVQDEPPGGMGTSGDRKKSPVDRASFPRTSVHLGQTATSASISSTSPRIPILTTNIYGNPSDPRTTAAVSGRIYTVGNSSRPADITKIVADITVVPHWNADTANGGGSLGGVAASWKNYGRTLARKGQTPIQTAIDNGIDSYVKYRDERPTHSFTPGQYARIPTGLTGEDAEKCPKIFLNIASVPPSVLKRSGQAAQSERMEYVQTIVRSALDGVLRSIKQSDLQPSLDNPIRVSMPLLCTGPDGAVSYEEAAAIMLKEIGQFIQEHPGIDFILPIHSGNDQHFDAQAWTRFEKIMSGDKEILNSLKIPTILHPEDMLDEFLAPLRITDTAKGVTFDGDYFNTHFATWKKQTLAKLATVTAEKLAHSPKDVAAIFETEAQALSIKNLIKWDSFTRSELTDNYLTVAEVTKASLKALLDAPDLAEDVFSKLHKKIETMNALEGFMGADKMDELIAATLSSVLSFKMTEKYEAILEQLKSVIKESEGKITELSGNIHESAAQLKKLEKDLIRKTKALELESSRLASAQQEIDDTLAATTEEINKNTLINDRLAKDKRNNELIIARLTAEKNNLEQERISLNHRISVLQSNLSSAQATQTQAASTASYTGSLYGRSSG